MPIRTCSLAKKRGVLLPTEPAGAATVVRPEVVSFHFGFPMPSFVDRLKRRGIKILSSATSVKEATRLGDHGCAQLLSKAFWQGTPGDVLDTDMSTQPGLLSRQEMWPVLVSRAE